MAPEASPDPHKGASTPPPLSSVSGNVSATTIESLPPKTEEPTPATPFRRENFRPKLTSRKTSGTIIIPRDAAPMPTPQGEYPPDDARAMSPRRSSEETNKLGEETRLAVQK